MEIVQRIDKMSILEKKKIKKKNIETNFVW